MPRNEERVLLSILKRYANARGLRIHTRSQDWIVVLTGPTGPHYVWGYDLGINSATTARLIADKAATFDVLTDHGLPAIEHRLFLEPYRQQFVGSDGTWTAILACHADFGKDSVVKPNEGTSGADVKRVQTMDALEAAVHSMFARGQNVALSPFQDFGAEVRVYVASGAPVLMYRKERPTLIGDGVRTIAELALARADEPAIRAAIAAGLERIDLASVPSQGTVVPVTWKHNLSLGSRLVTLAPSDHPALTSLAVRAAWAVGAQLAAVDIVETQDGSKVLEVNNGAMFETAVRSGDLTFEVAYQICANALDQTLRSKACRQERE